MATAIARHPLTWPAGRPRTPLARRERPKFVVESFTQARDLLLGELRRLGARSVILSTNVPLRQDGLPYANMRQPDDTGVAVYFQRKGRDLCLSCDRWAKVEHNLRAVADAIDSIRRIERRGTGEMVDQAFSGFAQLPPVGSRWYEVLSVDEWASAETIAQAYRRELARRHPDRGGSAELMHELENARLQIPDDRRP
jgi:hypothetical protein